MPYNHCELVVFGGLTSGSLACRGLTSPLFTLHSSLHPPAAPQAVNQCFSPALEQQRNVPWRIRLACATFYSWSRWPKPYSHNTYVPILITAGLKKTLFQTVCMLEPAVGRCCAVLKSILHRANGDEGACDDVLSRLVPADKLGRFRGMKVLRLLLLSAGRRVPEPQSARLWNKVRLRG